MQPDESFDLVDDLAFTASQWTIEVGYEMPDDVLGDRLRRIFHRGDSDVAELLELAANQRRAAGRNGAAPASIVASQPAPAAGDGRRQAVDGATFVYSTPLTPTAIWGRGSVALWAEAEGLLLVGPDGVGKTTLGQQLMLARAGVRSRVLEMPVVPTASRVLYVAADRPRQAARSLRRMVDAADDAVLRERLVVWQGPLPFDVTRKPQELLPFVREFGADTLVVDSLKDVALDLVGDEGGSRVNLAFQELIASEIQLLVLHHQRKELSTGGKPRKISDVYGSRWLTAGMGSIVLLWGEPGDLVVELSHLKQPAEEFGPIRVKHDHARGTSAPYEEARLEDLIAGASAGVTVADVARLVYALESKPTANQIEKARRSLERLVGEGHAERRDDADGTARYFSREVAA